MFRQVKPRGGAGIFIFVCVLLLASSVAHAAPDALQEAPTRFVPETGMVLRHQGAESLVVVVLALRTDVDIAVSGIIARVTVRQTFRNPDDVWVEGVYGFPLPDDAAVDTLRLRIGERVIEGEIREREKARKIYDQAKRAGQRTSDQRRPSRPPPERKPGNPMPHYVRVVSAIQVGQSRVWFAPSPVARRPAV